MFNLDKYSKGIKNSDFDRESIIKILQRHNLKKFLDLGCGDGSFTTKVAKTVKAEEIAGIEIDKDKCGKAKERGIKIFCQDLKEKFPFPDNYFDLVLSRQSIEHLYFTDRYLEEIKRVLKSEGIFVLTTTNLAGLHYRFMLLFGVQPMCLHPSRYKVFPLKGENPLYGHKSVFTYGALKEILRRHNFKIIKSRTHSLYFLPRWLSEIICCCLRNVGIYSFFMLKK